MLTEARYSRIRHYQVILPILPGHDAAATPDDLRVSSRDWLSVFADPVQSVLLPIPITQSVWYSDDVQGETEYVVDEETLREIDDRLCSYFSL